ncbi:thiamine-phosphate pyrophosphorylase [Hydrogenimonas thermophila]|uniref:thiamine-phosphate pyrophosphorylase n=1 Tax=Hydrogenimonas thermophila TaxID=223786 RepID=UPI00293719AE|nr:thiamine-phosphate pyrophosphorylase [Hydrogenimonas thermophila]WOE70012.1 thiamine-phosphate pyrophosphorylase [Hydrogenimonas thermophila]WOE72529.1 thiamine-phosphate pyrophosphorylase [Hydrogenimonas thermophila]
MTSNNIQPKLFRLIDANLNRLKEGIRVIEDINRYLYDNKTISSKLKELRHLAKIDNYLEILPYRDIQNDVLKASVETEMIRENISSLLLANYKRAQEASRVLEEAFKLLDPAKSENFKTIRYELYALEQENLSK